MQMILFSLFLTITTPSFTKFNLVELQAHLDFHKEITQFPSKVIPYQLLKESIINACKGLKEDYSLLHAIPEKDYIQGFFSAPNFTPFVKKQELQSHANLYFWGDLHGCAHAFLRSIMQLVNQNILDENGKLKNKDSYLIFLGDFVDRGMYGAEVLYLVCNLYIQNPKQVIIIRGNHEDINLNLLNTQASFIHE
jgi:hypothetical protein